MFLFATDFSDLKSSLNIIQYYETLSIEYLVEQFEEHTGQIVPEEAIRKFKMIGLSNIDFLTSDFLNNYNLKNLIQYENTI